MEDSIHIIPSEKILSARLSVRCISLELLQIFANIFKVSLGEGYQEHPYFHAEFLLTTERKVNCVAQPTAAAASEITLVVQKGSVLEPLRVYQIWEAIFGDSADKKGKEDFIKSNLPRFNLCLHYPAAPEEELTIYGGDAQNWGILSEFLQVELEISPSPRVSQASVLHQKKSLPEAIYFSGEFLPYEFVKAIGDLLNQMLPEEHRQPFPNTRSQALVSIHLLSKDGYMNYEILPCEGNQPPSCYLVNTTPIDTLNIYCMLGQKLLGKEPEFPSSQVSGRRCVEITLENGQLSLTELNPDGEEHQKVFDLLNSYSVDRVEQKSCP